MRVPPQASGSVLPGARWDRVRSFQCGHLPASCAQAHLDWPRLDEARHHCCAHSMHPPPATPQPRSPKLHIGLNVYADLALLWQTVMGHGGSQQVRTEARVPGLLLLLLLLLPPPPSLLWVGAWMRQPGITGDDEGRGSGAEGQQEEPWESGKAECGQPHAHTGPPPLPAAAAGACIPDF